MIYRTILLNIKMQLRGLSRLSPRRVASLFSEVFQTLESNSNDAFVGYLFRIVSHRYYFGAWEILVESEHELLVDCTRYWVRGGHIFRLVSERRASGSYWYAVSPAPHRKKWYVGKEISAKKLDAIYDSFLSVVSSHSSQISDRAEK